MSIGNVRTLRDQGKPILWMPFPREGHGLSNNETRLKYYSAVLEFLDRYIGPSSIGVPGAIQSATATASAPTR